MTTSHNTWRIHIYFYSCLEWRANYLWLWIQAYDPSRFDYSTFVILFLTSYFVVSKWWTISESNKFYFLSARKFRQQPNSRDELVTFRSWHNSFHCLTNVWRFISRDLNRTVFKMAVDWASKKIVENLIWHNISLICSVWIL